MINKNWKDHWKLVANNKNNNATHMAQYCILKALTARSQNKVEIAQSMLRAAFTPVTNDTELANGRRQFDTLDYQIQRVGMYRTIFGLDLSLFFDEEGYEEYMSFVRLLWKEDIKANEPDYMFLFVRQDISSEQQAVQAAHAAYVAGSKASPEADVNNVHFVLVGVENEEEVKVAAETLESNNVAYYEFYEPDLGDALTSVASQPIKEHQKRFLGKYKTLKFVK